MMKKYDSACCIFLFLLLLIYLAPSNGWLDTSELSSASFLLGIGHPPGQPLYSLVIKFFELVPLGNISFRGNLASAIFLILSFLFYLKIRNAIFKDFHLYGVTSTLIGLYFFLSYSFMIQGVRHELYSLNLFLCMAVIYFVFCKKYPMLVFFIAGLALGCHHLLIFLILPGLLLVLLSYERRVSFYQRGLFFFLLGSSIFLYLPLRAQIEPIYNFGSPSNFDSFIWVISGALYKSFKEINLSLMFSNIANVSSLFVKQTNIFFFIGGIAGLFVWSFKNFFPGIAFILILIANVSIELLNQFFDDGNPDLHGYLMVSFIVISLGFSYLFLFLLNQVKEKTSSWKWKVYSYGIVVSLVFSMFFQIFQSKDLYNKRNDWSAPFFGRNIIKDLPFNSLIIAGSFGTFSILNYLVFTGNFRNDIKLIYSGFLANSGYRTNIEKNYPGIEFPKEIKLLVIYVPYVDIQCF